MRGFLKSVLTVIAIVIIVVGILVVFTLPIIISIVTGNWLFMLLYLLWAYFAVPLLTLLFGIMQVIITLMD